MIPRLAGGRSVAIGRVCLQTKLPQEKTSRDGSFSFAVRELFSECFAAGDACAGDEVFGFDLDEFRGALAADVAGIVTAFDEAALVGRVHG